MDLKQKYVQTLTFLNDKYMNFTNSQQLRYAEKSKHKTTTKVSLSPY